MSLKASTDKYTQNKGNGDFIQEENKVELANIYESLQDRGDDVHPYSHTVRSGADAINSGANKEYPKSSVYANISNVKFELSCKAICLAITGILLFCTLICVITGLVVYHVVTAKMAESGTQTSQNQNITSNTNNPDTLAMYVKSLKAEVIQLDDVWKQLKSLRNESRDFQMDTKDQLDTLTNASRDTDNQLETIRTLVQAVQETQNISGQQVAFTAHDATGKLVNTVLTFKTVYLNLGGGYNQTTGTFTCPVAGTYLFSATLMSVSSRNYQIYCHIRKNAASVVVVNSFEGRHDSASVAALVHLSVGDLVDLGRCGNVGYIYTADGWTSFTGSLIQMD